MNTALILDDEELARKSLDSLLRKHCPQVSTVFNTATVAEAATIIKENKIDFLFLDVHLGVERGFALANQIDPEQHAIIFVTAYEQYALSAIKVNALDYLLKPINIDELVAAVEKASRHINRQGTLIKASDPIGRAIQHDSYENAEAEKLVITHWSGFDIIEPQKIIFAEADGNYTIFHLEGYKKIVSSKQIGYYEDILDPVLFFRSHKSFIINLKYLTGYSSREGYSAHMAEGYKITISRRKLPDFLELCKRKQL